MKIFCRSSAVRSLYLMLVVVWFTAVVNVFITFLPITYGFTALPYNDLQQLKWKHTWDFLWSKKNQWTSELMYTLGPAYNEVKRYKETVCWKPLLFISDFDAKKFVREIGVLVVTELLVSGTQCMYGAIINAVEPVFYNHLFNETIWFRTLLFLWTQRGKIRFVNNRSFCDEWKSAISFHT